MILSTDDDAIAEFGRSRAARCRSCVPRIARRDAAPAGDAARGVVARGTAGLPARRRDDSAADLAAAPAARHPHAAALLASSGADSVLSVSEVPAHAHPMRMLRVDDARGRATLFVTGEPVRRRINRRQEMPPAWVMNGAIYAFRTRVLFAPSRASTAIDASRCRCRRPVRAQHRRPEDWDAAERALAGSRHSRTRRQVHDHGS